MRRTTFILIVWLFLLGACGGGDSSEEATKCIENVPEHVSGLNVKGERSERNVIVNMWPVVCRAQELYAERLKDNPKLKGTIELNIMVEFNGEIGAYSINQSTMNDKGFQAQVLRLFQFMDFDFYGPHNSETEILYPIHFKP